MSKITESKKIEYSLIALLILSIGLTLISPTIGRKVLGILWMLLSIFCIIRIFYSFRHWKFNKGISVINFILNIQIFYSLMAMCYTFCRWPGYSLVMYASINSVQIFLIPIAIFLLIRWTKLNRPTYWEYLKENIVKALIGIGICFILFYAYDMPSNFKEYPPKGFGMPLPKTLF
jgi:hypothetical protein